MYSVNTNLASMAALEALNSTQEMLNTTQNAISTGKKVSSASDNPAIYAISNTMNANIAGLSAVSDSLSLGQSVLGVANSAASSISSQLQSLQQTVTQGEEKGIDTTTMNNQITAIVQNITQIANSATFNGVNLLSSTAPGVTSSDLAVVQDVTGSTLSLSNQNVVSSLGLSGLTVGAEAVQIGLGTSAGTVANGDSITLSDGTNLTTFQLEPAGTAASAPPAAPAGGTSKLITVTTGASASPSQMVGNLISAMQKEGFTATLDSNGNLQVSGKGISAAATGSAVSLGGVTSQTAVASTPSLVLAQVSTAITTMNNISATLGAKSQQVTAMADFTKSLSDSLTAGVGALTDADMAAESAKLQSLQTKQQLAIQSLSIANQQPQVMLKLFG